MYEFWYDYVKPKYGKKANLSYMDTSSFIVHVKTDYFYKDITKDGETRSDISNFEMGRPLPKGKNKKVIGLMKDELGRRVMKEFVRLKAKTYSCLKKKNNYEDNKGKDTKKYVIKRKLKFESYKNRLKAAKIDRKIKYLEKKKTNVDNL